MAKRTTKKTAKKPIRRDPSVLALRRWFNATFGVPEDLCSTGQRAHNLIDAAVKRGWTLAQLWRKADEDLQAGFRGNFGIDSSTVAGMQSVLNQLESYTYSMSLEFRKAFEAEKERVDGIGDDMRPVKISYNRKLGEELGDDDALSYTVEWE